jgi:sugar transferase (PEP-CTERM system associated)
MSSRGPGQALDETTMIRLFHVYFPVRTVLLVLSDTVFIVAGLLTTTLVWSHVRGNPDPLSGYAKVALVSFVLAMCLYYYDLYESQIAANLREVTTRLVQVLGTACIVLALLYYAYPGMQLGRWTLITGILLTGAGLVVCRRLFLVLNGSPRLTDRTLFLGHGALAIALAEELSKRPELGVRAIGYAGEEPENQAASNGLRRLGDLAELDELAQRNHIDRIIVAMQERRGRLPLELLLQLKKRGVRVQDGTRLYEEVTGKVSLDSLRLSSLVFSSESHPSKATLLCKRLVSIVGSALALAILSPFMGLIALLIWIDSPGHVIFQQKRVGKDGDLFTLFKFRSMWIDADSDGIPKPAEKDDKRMTRVGHLLRRARLDEIPQLYNVLRGDIDFVGPRPFVPEQEKELAAKIPFYSHRWAVRPGATGWAQVHRGYCATVEDNIEKLGYDLFYIRNISVGLDLLILFQTMKILILRRGAR